MTFRDEAVSAANDVMGVARDLRNQGWKVVVFVLLGQIVTFLVFGLRTGLSTVLGSFISLLVLLVFSGLILHLHGNRPES